MNINVQNGLINSSVWRNSLSPVNHQSVDATLDNTLLNEEVFLFKNIICTLLSKDSDNDLAIRSSFVNKMHNIEKLLKKYEPSSLIQTKVDNISFSELTNQCFSTQSKKYSSLTNPTESDPIEFKVNVEKKLNAVRDEFRNKQLHTQKIYNDISTVIRKEALHTQVTESKAEIDVNTSYADLWARVAIAISNIKTNYVDFYADLMISYTSMYEKFNETVQKAAGEAITSGSDGNTINFNKQIMEQGWRDFDTWIKAQKLSSVPGWENMNTAQKEEMAGTLEPAYKVDQNGKISFNLEQYNSSPRLPTTTGEVSTAAYQAWLASFNALGSSFQSSLQSFAQRYSQANSTFDNLNKVLSGVISTLADSAKQVLRSL